MKSKIEEAYDLLKNATITSPRGYATLYLIKKRADELCKSVEEDYIENNVSELIPQLGVKIGVQDGKPIYRINSKKLRAVIGQEKYNEISSVSQASLEALSDEDLELSKEQILALVKEQAAIGKPSIRVSSLSKEDLVNLEKRRVKK